MIPLRPGDLEGDVLPERRVLLALGVPKFKTGSNSLSLFWGSDI